MCLTGSWQLNREKGRGNERGSFRGQVDGWSTLNRHWHGNAIEAPPLINFSRWHGFIIITVCLFTLSCPWMSSCFIKPRLTVRWRHRIVQVSSFASSYSCNQLFRGGDMENQQNSHFGSSSISGKAVPFVELTVAHASVLTILAISFERYYAICEPLKAGYVCTKTRAILICFLAWIVAALFTR